MAYIKFARLAQAFALIALLSACGAMPKKDTSEQPTAEGQTETEAFVAIPNPYLAQKNNAPEAARKPFNAALAAMQSENWAGAQTLLQNLTETYPTLSGPHVNLGIVYWHQNALEAAEAELMQAIAVNPFNNDAYNQLGVLLREQGRFEEAEEWYQKALKVWPHAPVTLKNLGILYDLYMGRFDEALAAYELALKAGGEPNQQLQGWIIDIKRRMAEESGA